MANALITGAGGFVGQHLVRELLGAGYAVVGGTLDGAPPTAGVLTEAERARVRWVAHDVTDDGASARVLAEHVPEVVFHLAAQSSVGHSFGDVIGTWEANATGTLRLLLAIAGNAPRARVVLVSSSEVYGAVPEADQPIAESRAMAPGNPYGASKAAAELAARCLSSAEGPAIVVARSFNHTGPGQSTRFALPNWAEQLARMRAGDAEPVLRVGNLEARRDLLDVRDVAAAYRVLAERGVPGATYNVCSGTAFRLREVVEELVALSGTGARIEVDTARLRPVDSPLLLGDPSRLRALGWSAAIPIRKTLEDLLAGVGRSVA